MGKSHNPSGRSKATDGEVIDALEGALQAAEDDALAVSARDAAQRLPIERPAVKKRLDKLAQEKNTGVRRFKGAQAWLYYTPNESEPLETQQSEPAGVQSRQTPEPETDGGFTGLERKLFIPANLGVVSSILGIIAFLGYTQVGTRWYPKAAGDVFLTDLLLKASLIVFISSLLALLIVFFWHYLRYAKNQLQTELAVFNHRYVSPLISKYEQWFLNNRPGGESA